VSIALTDVHSTQTQCSVIIEDMQQEAHSREMQCDLLAGAPLQICAKIPGATKIVYNTGNEEDDVRTATAGVDYSIMQGDHDTDVEGDHNTGGADLDTSYQRSQDDTTTE